MNVDILRELLDLPTQSDATVLGAAYSQRLITAKEYVEATSNISCEEV